MLYKVLMTLSPNQNLLTQLRSRNLDLKHQAGVGPSMTTAAPYGGDADSEVRRLQTENVSMCVLWLCSSVS